LHDAGANVFFTYHSAERAAQAVAAGLEEHVAYTRCDLADAAALPALIDACFARFGSLHTLVNNAAIFARNPFDGDDYGSWHQSWERTFAVNVFGAADLAWLAMRRMRAHGGGRIINVASRAAHRGELSFADYGASKAALVNLTKSIARGCARDGILCFCVAPGFIDTDMAAVELGRRRAEVEAEIPSGRVGRPQEVAQVIAFLASPLADYATGATVDVNGGSYVR
jgi:NAD(P)-dependent dehydrogenase (short-subunit alcohol dehydrogenase family)